MNNHLFFRQSIVSFGLTTLLAVTAATAQVVGSTGIEVSGSFQQDVNACMSGRTQQDQNTCLTEARNAQADLVPSDLYDNDRNVIVDDNALVLLAG